MNPRACLARSPSTRCGVRSGERGGEPAGLSHSLLSRWAGVVRRPLGDDRAVLAEAVLQDSPSEVVRTMETSAVGLKLQLLSVRGGRRRCCSPTITSFALVVDVYGFGRPVVRFGMLA